MLPSLRAAMAQKLAISDTHTIHGMRTRRCPACGASYRTPPLTSLASIVTDDAEGCTYILVVGPLRATRHIVHECVPDAPRRPPSDDAPVPSRPPGTPPSRAGSIALDLPS